MPTVIYYYEVVTGPIHRLEAVDALIHIRETIKNAASEYGWRATLAPRVLLLFLPVSATLAFYCSRRQFDALRAFYYY